MPAARSALSGGPGLPDTSLQEVGECIQVVTGQKGDRRRNSLMDRLGINMRDSLLQSKVLETTLITDLKGYNLVKDKSESVQYIKDENEVKSSQELKGDIVQHSNKEEISSFYCSICEHSFQIKAKFNKHMKTEHYNIATVNCDICSASFVSKLHFNAHRKSHAQTNMCDLCGKGLSTQGCLDKHRLKVHGTEEEKNRAKKYVCKVCASRFYSNNRLAEHELIHSEIKTFQCDRCDFMSKTPHALTIHVNRKHLGKWKILKEQKLIKKEKQKQIRQSLKILNGGRYRAGKERDHFNKYMKNFQHRERTTCGLCQKETTSIDWHNKVYHLG